MKKAKRFTSILLFVNVVFLVINIGTYLNLNKIQYLQPKAINVQGSLRYKFNGEPPFSLGLSSDGTLDVQGDTVQAIKYLMEELHKSWQQNQVQTIHL